jgi:hypothetical protein
MKPKCPPCSGNCRQGRDCPNNRPPWGTIIVLLIVILLLSMFGRANDTLEATAEGLIFTDWMQTRYIVQHPAVGQGVRCHYLMESNPVLGQHPTAQKVNIYFPSLMAAHYEADKLMDERYKTWFEGGTIAAELVMVLHNRAIGIGFGF